MNEVRIHIFDVYNLPGRIDIEYMIYNLAGQRGFPVTGFTILRPDMDKISKYRVFEDVESNDLVFQWEGKE